MGAIGDNWGQLGTIGDNWGQFGTIGDNWGQLGQVGTIGNCWELLGTIVGDYRGLKVLVSGYLGSRGPKWVKEGHRYTNRGIFLNELQSFRGVEWAKGVKGRLRGVMRDVGVLGGSRGTIGILIGGFLGSD